MRHRFVFLPLISVLFFTFASCSQKKFTYDGKIWGTTYHIVYCADRNLDRDIDAAMQITDSELSMFNPSSAVSRLNSGADSVASGHFRRVFSLAQRVNAVSGGVYDPTIGPLSDIWGFGRGDGVAEPSDSCIAAALATVGIADCRIDGSIVRKKSPATVFDFSSIAKGYGIDLVGDTLRASGVENYMIEVGGEVLVCGLNPDGRPWHIQIDAPTAGFAHRRMRMLALGPEKTAVATSGNYRNFRRRADGTVYGHTLSPLTGRPVAGSILSATVIASDCATADAYATACMAAAVPDSAAAILRRAGLRGIITSAGADSLVVADVQ